MVTAGCSVVFVFVSGGCGRLMRGRLRDAFGSEGGCGSPRGVGFLSPTVGRCFLSPRFKSGFPVGSPVLGRALCPSGNGEEEFVGVCFRGVRGEVVFTPRVGR